MRPAERWTLALIVVAVLVTFLPARAAIERQTKGPSRGRIGLVFDVGGRGDKSFNDAACSSHTASRSRSWYGVGSGRFASIQAARSVMEAAMTAPRYSLISINTWPSCSRTGTPGSTPRSSSAIGAPSGVKAISISCCFEPVR